ncbi:Dual specificity protein phosphatase CDC14B (CDC14 cell division cycle 14 homolog B) [Durusdinium trenchii]|uniref:Dual specificity protein phosphatase CDC14B (CDC14 cell division cycle 14 homolog B) n=1 Tax=Durusdinium trenchii TaxID=1381693 RepID=A0ABP0SAI6_9DINO
MVKPSSGDQPPSDDDVEPQSQVSTSLASASHPSLASLETSRFCMADLGQGVWWLCIPSEGADPSAVLSDLPDVCSVQDAKEALKHCAEKGSGESRNASLCAMYPEEMESLGKLKWDGDGHYVLDPFPGDHPPTLGQIVSCLKLLDAAVSQSKTVLLLSSQKRRAVSATLAGAVLVLARGFSPQEAWQHILPVYGTPHPDPKVAWDRFPPPFSHSGETGPSSLMVIDCLQGLAVARQKNWLEDYRYFDVGAWKFMREKFDASWLIPGEILAMANPWGTSQNPRFPGLLQRGPMLGSQRSTQSLSLGIGMVKTPSGLSSQGNMVHSHTFPELCSQDAGDSFCLEEYADHDAGVDSEVCDPRFAAIAAEHAGSWKLPFSRSEEYARLREDTFVSLLLRNHCHEVARLNYDFECPEQKGYEKAFGENSIRLKKIPFVDGNIPNKEVVKEFLKSSGNAIKQNKTIALHCQGGMGRTGVMAGAHAAVHHQVDGTAFHGWTRICRPGTVQTVIQEEFLRKMQPNISRASSGKSLMERMRMRFSSV